MSVVTETTERRNEMKIKMLFLALCAKGLVIDLITSDDRTYQISGDNRFQGMYERLFHAADSHPTRRNVGDGEIQWAFDQAREIRLWTGPTEYRAITKTELEAELVPFPVR
jgi:hypothetical protein